VNDKGEIKDLAEGCGGDCCWFLVGLTDGKMTHVDGCWSSKQDVAEALYLRNQLHFGSRPDEWYAVHIEDVEPLPYNVNQGAVRACNSMLIGR